MDGGDEASIMCHGYGYGYGMGKVSARTAIGQEPDRAGRRSD